MKVFVGLGEGIGNVVMGLPLVDALHAVGHEVALHLRPTPPSIEEDLESLVVQGRRWLNMGREDGEFDAACLTHWWISRGGPMPIAREVFVGGHPLAGEPEILANLAAAATLAPNAKARAWLDARPAPHLRHHPRVGIHPGCKDDPDWKRQKVYPRWAEVTHRLKERGAQVVILGTKSDDAYCGEPQEDLRGRTFLVECARKIAALDVLVSGDSGLHHVAVALSIPTVALFGMSSVEKARHPDPHVKPVVFGPCETPEAFALLDPREIATAAIEAAGAR